MKPEGSMPHLEGLSNYPYPEQNQSKYSHLHISLKSILIQYSHLRLGLPKGIFPVKILKALLHSSFLITCPVHLNPLDLITLSILGERYKL